MCSVCEQFPGAGTTGGGGAPLYDGTPIPDVTVGFARTENHARLRVDGNIAKDGAAGLEGKVPDSFELEGKGPETVSR